jgi:hypothetical protein
MNHSKKWLKSVTSKKYREKLRKASNKTWSNPNYKKKMSKIMKKSYENPELIKKIDIAVTKWWKEHPNQRKKSAERLRKYFITHQKDFEDKFMNSKNNPFKIHIPSKLGLVRSKPEKKIADFLYKNKIKAYYEEKTLILDGYPCTPDFWLPKYKTYIEYYGGYPGSRPKKVLKNKLYPKHHIKVISITPAELYDLNRVILKEIKI